MSIIRTNSISSSSLTYSLAAAKASNESNCEVVSCDYNNDICQDVTKLFCESLNYNSDKITNCIFECKNNQKCQSSCIYKVNGLADDWVAKQERINNVLHKCKNLRGEKLAVCREEEAGITKQDVKETIECVNESCKGKSSYKDAALCISDCQSPLYKKLEGKVEAESISDKLSNKTTEFEKTKGNNRSKEINETTSKSDNKTSINGTKSESNNSNNGGSNDSSSYRKSSSIIIYSTAFILVLTIIGI